MPYLWDIEDDGVLRIACETATEQLRRKIPDKRNRKLLNVAEYALKRLWTLADFRLNCMVYAPSEQTLERFMELTEDSAIRYFNGKWFGSELYAESTIYAGVRAAFTEITAQYEAIVSLVKQPKKLAIAHA